MSIEPLSAYMIELTDYIPDGCNIFGLVLISLVVWGILTDAASWFRYRTNKAGKQL